MRREATLKERQPPNIQVSGFGRLAFWLSLQKTCVYGHRLAALPITLNEAVKWSVLMQNGSGGESETLSIPPSAVPIEPFGFCGRKAK